MDAKQLPRAIVGFTLFPGTLLLILALLASTVLALGFLHDSDPKAYEEYVSQALGLSGGTWYSLPPDAEEKIIAAGFDPAVVANEIMANLWINENGGKIDIGIQLSILEGESQGGNNMGSCSGIASAAKLSQREVEAARWLLEQWKEFLVRDWSDIARQMIREDYSDYTGHCSAGEIGPNGILPTTGVKICQDGLSSHPDNLVQSCNFFDKRVAPYGKNWWLKAIGYKSDETDQQKFQALYGWNHDEQYRHKLIARAKELNQIAGAWDFTPIAGGSYIFSGGWLQKLAITFLQSIGLLPQDVYAAPPGGGKVPPVGEFAHPYPGGFICGYGYGQPVGNGIHWGIDMCIGSPWRSAPIYAMHSGRVTFARYLSPSESLAGQWWISGNVVAIEGEDEEGNKIWTAYGHGATGTFEVQVGDAVEVGQKLMMSGSTGFSSGIHLHLGMKVNGQWVNPAAYLPGD